MRVRARPELHEPHEYGMTFPNFTVGRQYVVCSIEYDSYRLVDDTGEPVLAPVARFEVLDAVLPDWCIVTDEHRGPGMFLVPGFFERWHERDERFRALFELEYGRLIADDEARNGPTATRDQTEVRQAVAIELRAAIKPGWRVVETVAGINVKGPDSPEFVTEVWRLAQFIAYRDFVSIVRVPGPGRAYLVRSRSDAGLAFEVSFLAVPGQ